MIYILDQLEAAPGDGEGLHQLYMREYAPGATARGMNLVRTLVSPPLWLEAGANTLIYIWRLPDVDAFWRKNNLGRRDPDVHAVWARIDARAARRTRKTLADPGDFAKLADV